MWKDIIQLGNSAETIVLGEPTKTITYRSVYGDVSSVGRTEFYKAAALGLKPELIIKIHSFDYDADEYVKYNDAVYSITKVYAGGDFVELTVTSYIGV